VLPVYDAHGAKHRLDLEPCPNGRYLIDAPQKRYVITSNRPVRTAWELFVREAMGAGSPRYKPHTHSVSSSAKPEDDQTSPRTNEPGVSARRVAVQLLLALPLPTRRSI